MNSYIVSTAVYDQSRPARVTSQDARVMDIIKYVMISTMTYEVLLSLWIIYELGNRCIQRASRWPCTI
jgi:hypothetical protein